MVSAAICQTTLTSYGIYMYIVALISLCKNTDTGVSFEKEWRCPYCDLSK